MAEPTRQKKQQKPRSQPETSEGNDWASALFRSLVWVLPVGSVAAALGMGAVYGVGTALLTLAGGVLLIVISILWASVRTLAGDAAITLEEAC